MDKKTFQKLLCVMSGAFVAIAVVAFLFKVLHYPGGTMLVSIVVPILLMVEGCTLCLYLPKHSALRELIAAGNKVARMLLIVEICAAISIIVVGVGLLFRGMHYPGASMMLLVSCMSLAILSLIGGCLGAKLLNKE